MQLPTTPTTPTTLALAISLATSIAGAAAQPSTANADVVELQGRHPNGSLVPVRVSTAYTRSNPDPNTKKLASRAFNKGWTADGQQHDLCGAVVFEDLSPFDAGVSAPHTPARIDDCKAVAAALQVQSSLLGGWFNISGAGYSLASGLGVVAEGGACKLGVWREDGREDSFGIGDTDVVDVLTSAWKQYGRPDGNVHVVGEGPCGPVWFGFEIYGGDNPAPPDDS
ncbi:Uu.00g095770.m01.CDS01 [Anthostomella pinea]|uniref:Uu.00g095770.m01.CDS01 n=1 Tax=Anthostomella pinea TaxID=933095 RepID=A0AAI8VC60_9PEZI|nr:Uu.00g095770.m01.CDS01 [Anthostomella pinea]